MQTQAQIKERLKFKTLTRICPICDGNKGEILHTQSFGLYENASLPESYDVVMCSRCGFVYADTPASQNDYDTFYTNLSKYETEMTGSGAGISQIEKERLNRVAADIETIVNNKTASILDVGCASGGLLNTLKKHGFTNLHGIDPSQTCVNEAKDKGIDVHLGGIFFNLNEVFGSEEFELIILSHVLEHVKDIDIAIKNIISILKKSGFLYIEVPNAANYSKRLIAPFYFIDPEHINHFDQNSLSNFGRRNNLKPVKIIVKDIYPTKEQPYPAVACIFKQEKVTDRIIKTEEVKKSLLNHIKESELTQNNNLLERLAQSKIEIIVWGAGSNTHRLLNNSALKDCLISAFIDNDKRKQGQKIKGIKIYSPEILKAKSEPVLISAALFSDEIEAEIKKMGVKNKIIKLTGKEA